MRRELITVIVLVSLCVTTVAGGMQSPTVFKKLDFFIHTGDEVDDRDARLILDPQQRVLIFADEDRGSPVFATVDWDRITGITYENSKHARITAGLLVAWPMFFLKGRKHWLTVTFGPSESGEIGGYVYARMDKSNYQAILAAINGHTGYEIRRIEEGGEISVLYPGLQPADSVESPTAPSQAVDQAQPAAVAQPAGAPSQQAAVAQPAGAPSQQSSAAVPPADTVLAAPLPADSGDAIAAAPLPPAADAIQPPTLLSKRVQWTERAEGVVGFAWAAEVNNPNSVDIEAAVTLCLRDASGAVIHEAQERVVVPSGEVVACTAAGQMEESVALQAATWTFDVAALEAGSGEGTEAAQPPVASGVAGGAATAGNIEEPVPLTPDMVPPRLIAESVQIDIQDPELQDLNVSGKRLSMRCLVQSDGTVGAARVLKIDPPLSLKAASDALAHSVERSAVMYWRFTPAMRAGVPLPVWFTLTIRYEPAG